MEMCCASAPWINDWNRKIAEGGDHPGAASRSLAILISYSRNPFEGHYLDTPFGTFEEEL